MILDRKYELQQQCAIVLMHKNVPLYSFAAYIQLGHEREVSLGDMGYGQRHSTKTHIQPQIWRWGNLLKFAGVRQGFRAPICPPQLLHLRRDRDSL